MKSLHDVNQVAEATFLMADLTCHRSSHLSGMVMLTLEVILVSMDDALSLIYCLFFFILFYFHHLILEASSFDKNSFPPRIAP